MNSLRTMGERKSTETQIRSIKSKKTESYPIRGISNCKNAAHSDPIPSMSDEIVERALFCPCSAGYFARSIEIAALRILYGPPRKNPIAKMTKKYGRGSSESANFTRAIKQAAMISCGNK